MPEHGTRTMYVHYACRCDECCRAEHMQYIKRTKSKNVNRVRSKWGENQSRPNRRLESQRKHNANRYTAIKQTGLHTRTISWRQIADDFDMKCAICGSEVNPDDWWIGEHGRKCYGRKYPTVDHIIALKNGGSDIRDNLQLACKQCNSRKGASK